MKSPSWLFPIPAAFPGSKTSQITCHSSYAINSFFDIKHPWRIHGTNGIFTYLEKHKLDFFWLNGFDWFFWSLRRCILYRQMWPYMFFFQHFGTPFFQQNVEKLWLCYAFGFGTKAIYGHICPYMAIYDHFFGHPESTASIRFDHCFWSLRVIVVIDEIFCVLRGLAKTTEKNTFTWLQVHLPQV